MKKLIALVSVIGLTVSVFGMAKAPEKKVASDAKALIKEAGCCGSTACAEKKATCSKEKEAACAAKKEACTKKPAEKKDACGGCPLSK